MLTAEHFAQLKHYLQAGEAEHIHELVSQLSVADQKRMKLQLASDLSDRSLVSLEQSLQIYVGLLGLNLNLYFRTFLMNAERYADSPVFWNRLEILAPLGKQLKKSRTFYRHELLKLWIDKLEPGRDVRNLFLQMGVIHPIVQLNYLMESNSLYAYYQFLQFAIKQDVEKPLMVKFCKMLLIPSPSGTLSQSFREDTANFLIHFFDLNYYYPFHRELDATLFAYAEKSYESFLKVIVPASRIDSYLKGL